MIPSTINVELFTFNNDLSIPQSGIYEGDGMEYGPSQFLEYLGVMFSDYTAEFRTNSDQTIFKYNIKLNFKYSDVTNKPRISDLVHPNKAIRTLASHYLRWHKRTEEYGEPLDWNI